MFYLLKLETISWLGSYIFLTVLTSYTEKSASSCFFICIRSQYNNILYPGKQSLRCIYVLYSHYSNIYSQKKREKGPDLFYCLLVWVLIGPFFCGRNLFYVRIYWPGFSCYADKSAS